MLQIFKEIRAIFAPVTLDQALQKGRELRATSQARKTQLQKEKHIRQLHAGDISPRTSSDFFYLNMKRDQMLVQLIKEYQHLGLFEDVSRLADEHSFILSMKRKKKQASKQTTEKTDKDGWTHIDAKEYAHSADLTEKELQALQQEGQDIEKAKAIKAEMKRQGATGSRKSISKALNKIFGKGYSEGYISKTLTILRECEVNVIEWES